MLIFVRSHRSLLVFFVLAFSSCKVLTPGQLENINLFASASHEYCDYPSTVAREYTLLHLQGRLLALTKVGDTALLYDRIMSERRNYLKLMNQWPAFDSSILLVRLYSKLLLRLSDDSPVKHLDPGDTAIGEKIADFAAKIESMHGGSVPAGTAARITDAVKALGERYIRHRQAKVLKQVIPAADMLIRSQMNTLIAVMGKTFINAAHEEAPGMETLIEMARQDFKKEFNINIGSDPTRLNYQSVQFYYDGLVAFEQLDTLRLRCITAAGQLAEAHSVLTKSMQSKENLKDVFVQTKDLASSLQKLKDLAMNFQPSKSK